MENQHTYSEIKSQPNTWAVTLETFQNRVQHIEKWIDTQNFDTVVFIGCGSTHYLALSAASLWQARTGIPARGFPSSEALLHPDLVFPPHKTVLLVSISRSGETTETVEATRQFLNARSGGVICITCDSQSSLADLADLLLAADQAQENSVVQTQSFTSMLIMAQALAGLFAETDISALDTLPSKAESLFQYESLCKEIGSDLTWNHFVFLGGGSRYGIASEAMLKMKEMTLSNTEAYHPLEYRHGPMSLITENTLILGLISEEARSQEIAVLEDMQDLGARILALADKPGIDLEPFEYQVTLQSDSPHWTHPPLYLPIPQLIAYYRAIAKKLNPDQPTNLTAVIQLDSVG